MQEQTFSERRSFERRSERRSNFLSASWAPLTFWKMTTELSAAQISQMSAELSAAHFLVSALMLCTKLYLFVPKHGKDDEPICKEGHEPDNDVGDQEDVVPVVGDRPVVLVLPQQEVQRVGLVARHDRLEGLSKTLEASNSLLEATDEEKPPPNLMYASKINRKTLCFLAQNVLKFFSVK